VQDGPQKPEERTVPERHGQQGQDMKMPYLDHLKKLLQLREILHQQRMLVRRSHVRSQGPVTVDHRIVPHRLDENTHPLRGHHPGQFGKTAIQIEVMENGIPANDIEAFVCEIHVFRIHNPEIDRQIVA